MIATLAAAPAVAFTDAVRFATNIVRVDHEMRSVMVTANGKIITEKIIRGAARLPALKEQNRLRKLYRCEGFEERFEMETFEVGQRVKIIAGAYNMDGAEGTFGTIVKRGELNYWTWIVKVDFPGAPSDELGFNEDELELVTTPPPAVASAAADVSRDTQLRNDLFGRVREVLDLAAFYAPGELGEFPEKVAKTVADFKNYGNLAEKQIQERDETIARLEAELARVKAGLDDMRKLVLAVAAPLHQDIVDFEQDADEDEDFLQWFAGRADSELFYATTYAAYEIYERVSNEQASAPPADGEGVGDE